MNSKQFLKLIVLIFISCSIFYLFVKSNIELTRSIVFALSTTPPYVLALNTAVTLYLLKYVDSISSSITPLKTEINSEKIKKFQHSLKNLNQEAISNLILAIVLFIVLKALETKHINTDVESIFMVVLALQFSLISMIFTIAIIQVNALKTAISYRQLIENEK